MKRYDREHCFKLVFQIPYYDEINIKKYIKSYMEMGSIVEREDERKKINIQKGTYKILKVGKRIEIERLKERLINSEFVENVFNGIYSNLEELDKLIQDKSGNWKIERLNGEALSALRVAVYELKNKQDIPEGIIVNAAVEITKKYGDDKTASLVNAILRKVCKEVR